MKTLHKIFLITYTIIVGLLIPIALFLKVSSFNKDYYPTSFIQIILFLIITFISLVIFQTIKNKKSSARNIFRYVSIVLILIGLGFQIFSSFDLYKESVNSTGDIIFLSFYIIFGLIGIVSLVALNIPEQK